MPIPQVVEEHVEVTLVPQERIWQGTEEQIIDVLVRQVAAEMMESALGQSMDVSVLQAVEEMGITMGLVVAQITGEPVPQELVPPGSRGDVVSFPRRSRGTHLGAD